jgi:hypothetical protein
MKVRGSDEKRTTTTGLANESAEIEVKESRPSGRPGDVEHGGWGAPSTQSRMWPFFWSSAKPNSAKPTGDGQGKGSFRSRSADTLRSSRVQEQERLIDLETMGRGRSGRRSSGVRSNNSSLGSNISNITVQAVVHQPDGTEARQPGANTMLTGTLPLEAAAFGTLWANARAYSFAK